MLLRDLEALEAAYEARGYRVAYEQHMLTPGPGMEIVDGDGWCPGELVKEQEHSGDREHDDQGRGWATMEQAVEIAARLRRVGGAAYRKVRVIGPDGAEVHEVGGLTYTLTATASAPSTPPFGDETPAAATTPQPSTAPAAALPVTMGVPLDAVTVLALRDEGGGPSETVLVGDGAGQVWCCYRGQLDGRAGVRWRAKQTTFESVNVTPDRTLDFHDLYWPASAGGGLAARVAFWGGEGDSGGGLWWTLRRSA